MWWEGEVCMVGWVYGDSGKRCLADSRFECGYGMVKVECGVNRLVIFLEQGQG